MHRLLFLRAGFPAALALLALSFPLTGCGQDGPVLHATTGTVTYAGAPITEGTVQFEDPATGHADSAALGAAGEYEVQLPAGTYKVVVLPPMVEVSSGPNSPPSQQYKPVANIPAAYRAATSTPLSATVSPESLQHDFNLEPPQ